jgi:hypothetical protein
MNGLEIKLKNEIINYANNTSNFGIKSYKNIKKNNLFLAELIIGFAKQNSENYLKNVFDSNGIGPIKEINKIFYKEILNNTTLFYYLLDEDFTKQTQQIIPLHEKDEIKHNPISIIDFLKIREVAYAQYCKKLSFIRINEPKISNLILKLSNNGAKNYIKKINYIDRKYKLKEDFKKLLYFKEEILYQDLFFSLINIYSIIKNTNLEIYNIKKNIN